MELSVEYVSGWISALWNALAWLAAVPYMLCSPHCLHLAVHSQAVQHAAHVATDRHYQHGAELVRVSTNMTYGGLEHEQHDSRQERRPAFASAWTTGLTGREEACWPATVIPEWQHLEAQLRWLSDSGLIAHGLKSAGKAVPLLSR